MYLKRKTVSHCLDVSTNILCCTGNGKQGQIFWEKVTGGENFFCPTEIFILQ